MMGEGNRTDGGTREAVHRDAPLMFVHVSRLQPCPYLPNRLERKLAISLDGPAAAAEYEKLTHAGFRRSHVFAYRPACPGCNACIAVRVRAAAYAPSASLARVARRNSGVTLAHTSAIARSDHAEVFRKYVQDRHAGGGMADMDMNDYAAMITQSGVDTRLAEFRQADGTLYGVMLYDVLSDGLSAVYLFFDPALSQLSPGNYMIIAMIEHAKSLGLDYVYLGYWIAECGKMSYKTRFQPMDALTPKGWMPLPAPKATSRS